MAITIKEVITKKDLIKWVRFPNELYKNNENFVPFLENDEIDTFTKEILPYHDEDNKPHYLYNAEDLWNLVKNHILDSCKPCVLKNSN